MPGQCKNAFCPGFRGETTAGTNGSPIKRLCISSFGSRFCRGTVQSAVGPMLGREMLISTNSVPRRWMCMLVANNSGFVQTPWTA